MTPYMMYRGKCKEMSEAAVAADPTLTLVRGWYYDPVWNKEEQHWWTKRQDGTIFDPTKGQFPTNGLGDYREHDGFFHCAECESRVHETKAIFGGASYAFCSGVCFMKFVGVYEENNAESVEERVLVQSVDWDDDDGPF